MRIAIHHRPDSFSEIWIDYCKEKNIPYKLVNCFDSDIINQLSDCHGLMWHWDLTDNKPALFARQLTLSLEKKGLKVFPDSNTSWHYDDKVGQKYLFEAIGVPFINTYVFYTKRDAISWVNNTTYPKVWKLRGGAGSSNVKLIHTKDEARKIVNKAFTSGFRYSNSISRLKERIWIFNRDKNLLAIKKLITGIARLFIKKEVEKFSQRQIGYVYFQDFIPGNNSDTRLVVVNNRCMGMTRYIRENDFRASGSGLVDFNHELIHTQMVQLAFDTAEKLKTQSLALDFIKDKDGYKIIEMSYAFISESFPGYWDQSLTWHEKSISPQRVMIENFIHSINSVSATVQ